MCVCVHARVCVCVCVCVLAHTCVCLCVCVHACARAEIKIECVLCVYVYRMLSVGDSLSVSVCLSVSVSLCLCLSLFLTHSICLSVSLSLSLSLSLSFFSPSCFLTGLILQSHNLLLQLLDVVYREETLLNVIKSVTRNGRSIILTAVLAVILIYLFSIIGYIFFKDDFIMDVDAALEALQLTSDSELCVC